MYQRFMSDERTWLEDIVVYNSGADEEDIATIEIYRNLEAMLVSVDPMIVGAGCVAFTAGGDRVMLGVDDHRRVICEGLEPTGDHGRGVVHTWLRKLAADTLARRRQEGLARGKREAEGVLPETIEGLIAYSGFTR